MRKRFCILFVGLAICGALIAQEEKIDWRRAQELHRKSQQGEKLSIEDQAYLDKAKEARKKEGHKSERKGTAATMNSPTHFTPLTELGDGNYHGESGGLYGGGRNDPPKEIQIAAEKQTARIRPLDKEGKPSESGKVVLLSLGMSNTTGEFSRFQEVARKEPQLSPKLVIVDGAQGGKDARITSEESAPFWGVIDQRLQKAGVSPKQVQVVWLKQAIARPTAGFPKEMERLEIYLEKIVAIAKKRYPNLRIVYLSSRSYAGYATTALNPEPYAYESAFAVRHLIFAQSSGKPDLNFEAVRAPVNEPLLLWGPYLWADGETPRKIDGLFYKREDYRDDGTHPSDSGRQKITDQLLKFFKTDSNAKKWFLKP